LCGFVAERTLNVDDIQIFDVYFTGREVKMILFLYQNRAAHRLKIKAM